MENKRQKKVARQLQKDLGEIFQQSANSHFNGAFITVTGVKMTPDLGIARVYLSFLMTKDIQKALLNVQEHNSYIRGELGRRVGRQMRKVPSLEYFVDDTAEEMQKVEKLFENLHIPPAEDQE